MHGPAWSCSPRPRSCPRSRATSLSAPARKLPPPSPPPSSYPRPYPPTAAARCWPCATALASSPSLSGSCPRPTGQRASVQPGARGRDRAAAATPSPGTRRPGIRRWMSRPECYCCSTGTATRPGTPGSGWCLSAASRLPTSSHSPRSCSAVSPARRTRGPIADGCSPDPHPRRPRQCPPRRTTSTPSCCGATQRPRRSARTTMRACSESGCSAASRQPRQPPARRALRKIPRMRPSSSLLT
mmetsp:Transcript_33450/g.78619  ORF Transcript_33450/g.78619 Transcript_33450/m.78619 type:complete len:242 (+) Transcript_33450:116-841(+)